MPLPTIRLRGDRPRALELYEALRASILDGSLEADERLVEETVAAAVGVSRTPVREAFHRLEVDGLVQTSGRGLIVSNFTLEQLSELCSVRETLEAMATGLAATSMTEIEVITLRDVHQQYRRATESGDVQRVAMVNHAFHETIWQGGRNGYLRERLLVLRSQIERLQQTTLADPGRQDEALQEHEAMVDAIERHDSEDAEAVARQHFRKAMALRLTNLRLTLGGPSRTPGSDGATTVPSRPARPAAVPRSTRSRVR
jgi:DNA-binding GntR family transcriptional regulator